MLTDSGLYCAMAVTARNIQAMALTAAIRPTLQGRSLLPIKYSRLSLLRKLQHEMKEAEALPGTVGSIRISAVKSRATISRDRPLSAQLKEAMTRQGLYSEGKRNKKQVHTVVFIVCTGKEGTVWKYFALLPDCF